MTKARNVAHRCLRLFALTPRRTDFRFMATSDLLNELQKESFKVDPDNEKRICAVRVHCNGALAVCSASGTECHFWSARRLC